MVTIDENMLTAHGVKIPEGDAEEFLTQLKQRVEEQVGLALIEKLNDEDAKQVLQLSAAGKEEEVTAWLQQHVPNYDEVVQKEVDMLLDDLAASMAK